MVCWLFSTESLLPDTLNRSDKSISYADAPPERLNRLELSNEELTTDELMELEMMKKKQILAMRLKNHHHGKPSDSEINLHSKDVLQGS